MSSPAATTHPTTSRLSALRAAIVTGSSSGIGRAIALAVADAGSQLVVCADLRALPPPMAGVSAEGGEGDDEGEGEGEEEKKATHEVIAERYGRERAVFVRCDVGVESGEGGVEEMVRETVRSAGRVDL